MENFEVKQFWHFAAVSADRLAQFLKIKMKEEKADAKADAKGTGRKSKSVRLAELWQLVKERERKNSLVVQQLSLGQCCVPAEDNRGFTIDAIGTSPAQASKFENRIRHSFDSELKFNPKLNHRDPNLCSCGMLIQYGATRILLGGDIEREGWKDLVTQRPYLATGLNLVKVAHHGSPNGYCDGLWELHQKNVDITYKVLTPYKRFDLPKKSTIEHLERHGGFLYSAGDPYFDREFVPNYVTSMKILREKRDVPNHPSRVSFTFDDAGNSTGIELDHEAIQIC